MKSNNAKDEDDGKSHNHDRVDLQPRRLIGVKLWRTLLAASSADHMRLFSLLSHSPGIC